MSAEYRLETDTHELEDREHLTPHTPVADQVNTSYPNSEEEEEESTPNIPGEHNLDVSQTLSMLSSLLTVSLQMLYKHLGC